MSLKNAGGYGASQESELCLKNAQSSSSHTREHCKGSKGLVGESPSVALSVVLSCRKTMFVGDIGLFQKRLIHI